MPFLVGVSLASIACANERVPVEAFKPQFFGATQDARQQLVIGDREQARRDFIAARKEFADGLAAVMTTEQLAARARELSVEIQMERAQERFDQVRRRLSDLEREGRIHSDEAQRLKQRATRLEAEVVSLRKLLDGSVREQDDAIVTKVIVGQFQKEMAEETEYLADVLDSSELSKQSVQLRQMAKLGQFATGLKMLEDEPALIQDDPPEIGTAQ
jgi:predicted nuclease with TOPRIM domain